VPESSGIEELNQMRIECARISVWHADLGITFERFARKVFRIEDGGDSVVLYSGESDAGTWPMAIEFEIRRLGCGFGNINNICERTSPVYISEVHLYPS
jgi:hypothetical protein